MRYEICRMDGGRRYYVAHTDNWEWADKISRALSETERNDFNVFANGRIIRNYREALEESLKDGR